MLQLLAVLAALAAASTSNDAGCVPLPLCRAQDWTIPDAGQIRRPAHSNPARLTDPGSQASVRIIYESARPSAAFVMKTFHWRGAAAEEARVLGCLANIPGVIVGRCRWPSRKALVLEYAPRGDLATAVEGGFAALARQLIGAVWTIHQRGWIHHDIKPHNVVLTAEHGAALIDFGLATPIGQPRRGRGTRLTKAPEQVLQSRQSDPVTSAIDWWALGVTLFYARCRALFPGVERDCYPYSLVYDGFSVTELRDSPMRKQVEAALHANEASLLRLLMGPDVASRQALDGAAGLRRLLRRL